MTVNQTEAMVVNPSEYGLEPTKATELLANLPQIKEERFVLEQQYNDVIRLDIEDAKTAKVARELRLKIKDNRTKGIQHWHKVTKDYFLKGGQFIDAIKNKEIAVNERMENALEEIEKYTENKEKERIASVQKARIELISPYVEDTTSLDFGSMPDDVFEAYLNTKKKNYQDRIDAALKAEEERMAMEKAEAEAREAQRIENERLKAEVEKREAEIKAERERAEMLLAEEKARAEKALAEARAKAEAERMVAEEKARIKDEMAAKQQAEEKAKQDAILKSEQEAKAKLEAELRAKREAEQKAEAERLASELQVKKEADRLAKAPVKKQLKVWVESFELPKTDVQSEIAKSIQSKFEAYKTWALSQVENM